MAGLEINLGQEDLDSLARSLVERVRGELEEGVGEMLSERVREILATSGVWVPRMLKMSQVAEILQVPESKARQLCADEIPRLNLSGEPGGRTIRVDPRDLEAWLDSKQEFPARREALREWMRQSEALHRVS